jgi:hypothetical protein
VRQRFGMLFQSGALLASTISSLRIPGMETAEQHISEIVVRRIFD